MRQYMFKHKFLLVTTVLVRCIGAAMQVYIALLIQQLIDYVVGGDMNGFVKAILFAAVYFSLMGLVDYLTSATQAIYLKKTLIALKRDVFKGILAKDYEDFNKSNTADYLSNLTNDMNLIEANYITPFLMMIGDVVIFVGTTAVLLWINPWVTLAMFLMAALLMIVPSLFGKVLEKRQNKVSDKQGMFTSKIKDIFQGYEVVKSYRMIPSVTHEFNVVNDELEDAKFKSTHLKGVAQAVSMIFAIGTQIAGMAIAGYFVLLGQMTVGNLFAVVQLGNGIQGPIMWIMQKVTQIKGMSGVNEKIMALIEVGKRESNEVALSEFKESIRLENVHFAYEETLVLNGISYTFSKNKKYAIVGESGCGKSTLIKLMMGYYRDYEGQILVDGQDVKNPIPLSMTELASMIHQNIYLFDKTIADNIFLDQTFADIQIKRALTQSGVTKFIKLLPEALKTAVGENGKNLSGGQKQRVAIARALIQEMPILMLDEGTSALDLQTAYDIEKTLFAIDELTVITITHKLSEEILSDYDEIIVMDQGQIVESGSFNHLLTQKGAFYQLYTLKKDDDFSVAS